MDLAGKCWPLWTLKVWEQLKQEGYSVAHCTVSRLMQQLEIQGVWRGKNIRVIQKEYRIQDWIHKRGK